MIAAVDFQPNILVAEERNPVEYFPYFEVILPIAFLDVPV